MKKLFFAALLVLSAGAVFAYSGAASFLREGVSAEEMALGGAGTASVEGVNGVYWNPAGLTRMGAYSWQVSSMYSVETLDRHYAYLATARHSEDFGDFGVSLLNYGVGNIEILDETGVSKGTESDNELALGFSYANKVNYQLRYGGTVRGHYQELVGFRATGYSADLGFIFQPMLDQEVYFGVMLQNVLGDLYWTGYKEDILSTYKAGVSVKFFEEALKIALDAVKEEGYDPLIFRAGAEFRLLDYIYLRGGIDERYPVAGAGFKYQAYKVDYAYSYDRYELGDSHRISLMLMW